MGFSYFIQAFPDAPSSSFMGTSSGVSNYLGLRYFKPTLFLFLMCLTFPPFF
jgi:hypothetical protein